ncbi:hypothetical protein AAHC03_05367 [Spirometra sp. Aus1]
MPRKAAPKRAYGMTCPIPTGFQLNSDSSRQWVIDQVVGQGGFGRIYCAYQRDKPRLKNYVVKIEPQENGPLFTEIHFYMRVCKQELLEEWKTQRGLNFLGIPRFVDRGLFVAPDGKRCRFLVMDRFDGSLEDYLLKHRLAPSDIPLVAIQALNALEYIHSKNYVHADLKASNLLGGSGKNEFYLVDFGLVALYRVNGVHVAEKPSPKLKDNGTLEFCSRDAHKGLPPSRRGDIEILAFNLVHWLYRSRPSVPQGPSSGLPWDDLISDPSVRLNVSETTRNRIVQMKEDSMRDFSTFSESAGFGCLPALENFLRLVGTLGYSDPPNYTLLESTLRELAKSLSLRGNHGASHRPSDRSRVVFKKKLPPSTDNSVDSQTEVRSVTKKSNFLSNHVVDTYCGSSIDRHPEVGAHPSPHLLREHEAPRRSPRLKAGRTPGAARANGHFHVEVATKSPLRPPTYNISDPQACQSSLDYISSVPTPSSADYAHRRRPKRYVGPQPDGTVSPLLAPELPVCQPSETRKARTVTKASVSSQTSPHLLAVARARANERRRQAL